MQGLRCLHPLPFGNGRPHGRERGLFLKRRVRAVQGAVDHFAPTRGWKVEAVEGLALLDFCRSFHRTGSSIWSVASFGRKGLGAVALTQA